MTLFLLLLAGIFLPLFPFSMIFSAVFSRLSHPVARILLLLLWPQAGVWLLAQAGLPLASPFFVGWAIFTFLLYALRLLTVRDLFQWSAMLLISATTLTWLLASTTADRLLLQQFVLWLTVAPVFLVFLAEALKVRFGAAYAGLFTGLARRLPRLSALLVFSVLAAMALPIFPAFFSMLGLMVQSPIHWGVPVLIGWLFWTWAGTRLLNGFVFGTPSQTTATDLCLGKTLAIGLGLMSVVILNLIWTGVTV
ncbi:hypothetical protein [Halothiobacillus sp. DCM-1]|uniref:hypothetical protein n=1 Tax=Halothiobacillus sp. DCM-1 TaxID=3112558 RepID=UPI003246626A